MRYIYNVRTAVVACSALLAMSCTDYLDYNTVPEAVNPAADKTLWENISENENFTSLPLSIYTTVSLMSDSRCA